MQKTSNREEDANANDADVDVPLDEVKELLADAKRRGSEMDLQDLLQDLQC